MQQDPKSSRVDIRRKGAFWGTGTGVKVLNADTMRLVKSCNVSIPSHAELNRMA